jgi:predicted ester cyclase
MRKGREIMPARENKELLGKVISAWNELGGDVIKINSLYDKYYSRGYVFHTLHHGDLNLEQSVQSMVTFMSEYEDFHYFINDILAEGDKVVFSYTYQATIKATFMGIHAAGKQIAVKGVEIYRIVGGKIAESWDFHDSLAGMIQLGIIPRRAPET